MSGLRELQLGFSRDVFSGGGTGFGQHIKANGLSGDQRLQIYRNNTYASLTAALQATYPVTERLVGTGCFAYAAHEYITRQPSTTGNLYEFGAAFPEFLATFRPLVEIGYLPDVARLEWAYEQVYYAAERSPLDSLALMRVPQEQYGALKFELNPASRLLVSDYPILRIWQVNQPDYPADPTVDLAAGGIRLLVRRNPDLEVEFHPLQEGEFTLLQALTQACDFATACEQALAKQPDFDLPASFRRYVAHGVLVDFFL